MLRVAAGYLDRALRGSFSGRRELNSDGARTFGADGELSGARLNRERRGRNLHGAYQNHGAGVADMEGVRFRFAADVDLTEVD